MTSKNSFLVNGKENHKRRIWVWIVSFLAQLAAYPGILMIYSSRIRFNNAQGFYETEEIYRQQMQTAMADALGFHPNVIFVVLFLGALIAVQGFSYLYDRKKVDFYHSVPVSAKKRFAIVYGNGLLIYVIPYLFSLLLALGMAAAQGEWSAKGLAECGFSFVMNLLCFLVVYHTALLAVILTGNIVITVFAIFTFLFIDNVWKAVFGNMKHLFFEKASSFYSHRDSGFTIALEYWENAQKLKVQEEMAAIVKTLLPLYAKWFVFASVLFALAYLCYIRRPSEAAGKAIAFRKIKPFVKIILSVTFGIGLSCYVYEAGFYNTEISVLALLLGTLLFCGVMEALFEFDIRAGIRHPLSSIAATGIAAAVFGIYCFDIFGYDAYVPKAEKVESAAVDIGGYTSHWDLQSDTLEYISKGDYLETNMFLTDVEAVCALAEKNLGNKSENIAESRTFYVLYRLKSGRNVERSVTIDLLDETNTKLLNRIIGTQEYREGIYQIAKDTVSLERMSITPYYTNGTTERVLPPAEAARLREAWLKDMEQYNFSLVRENKICGEIEFEFRIKYEYERWDLPVYESFSNTIAVLKENGVFSPRELPAQDIASIEITRYLNEEEYTWYDTASARMAGYKNANVVTEIFENPEEIAKIAKGLYPDDLRTYWDTGTERDEDYKITVVYKAGTDSYSGKNYYHSYHFLNGQTPDFVAERMKGETE